MTRIEGVEIQRGVYVAAPLRALSADPLVRFGAFLLVTTSVVYLVPMISTETLAALTENWFDLLFVPLIVVALRVGYADRGPGTRRFINYLTAACGFWIAVRLSYVSFPDLLGTPRGDLPLFIKFVEQGCARRDVQLEDFFLAEVVQLHDQGA